MWKIFILSIFIIPSFLIGIIIETADFSEIQKHIENVKTEKILILCDIDDTLLRCTTHLGSTAWGSYIVDELVKKCITKDNAKTIENILWNAVHPYVKVESVDPNAPKIIKNLQDNNILVMGLTARSPEQDDLTIDQLLSIGINLEIPNQNYSFQSSNSLNRIPGYKKGVIFATPFNKKSTVLFNFLNENKIYPDTIIFIDDKLGNINDLAQSCFQKDLSYVGIRFSRADENIKSFKPEIADIQWSQFPNIVSDKEAESILLSQTLEGQK